MRCGSTSSIRTRLVRSDFAECKGARGSVVSWGTMLQAGSSRVRVPMRWIFLFWANPSSRPVALESTQPLTDVSQLKVDNLTAIYEPIAYRKRGNLDVSQPYGPLRPVSFTLTFLPFTRIESRSRGTSPGKQRNFLTETHTKIKWILISFSFMRANWEMYVSGTIRWHSSYSQKEALDGFDVGCVNPLPNVESSRVWSLIQCWLYTWTLVP
jgi:hypothetical protein